MAHELAHPQPLIIGGFPRQSLSVSNAVHRPFATSNYELGLHIFVDANLGAPHDDVGGVELLPISEGGSNVNHELSSRSMSGIVPMLGGAPLAPSATRQHLKAPDSHTSEVTAAGTAVTMSYMLAGILQELYVPQLRPVPILCDSQSTIFCANSAAAIKRSVWTARRAAVLREAVDMQDVQFVKVESRDNIADAFTRPIDRETFLHHATYMQPQRHPEAWPALALPQPQRSEINC